MQFSLLKLLVLIPCVLLSACSKTIHWQDEVLLSSNQKMVIDRSVELIPAELGHRRPTTYEIRATDPITGKRLNWDGDFGLSPIMLDFKNGNAFIVALPMMCDAMIKEFSIKGFPYIFMKSIDGENWETISPSQFPLEYKNSNMSAGYDSYRIEKSKFLSSEEISKGNKWAEKSTRGFFQISIPRSQSEWNYKGNKNYTGCGR